jgi:hypothetical protein
MPKPQLTTAGTRPLRVAYLVDTDDCPDALLDSIFSEAYGRWGGRRTLIVPTKADGIDDRYKEWLLYFDADVIYSFVGLNDPAVAAIHEIYCPTVLLHHSPIGSRAGEQRSFWRANFEPFCDRQIQRPKSKLFYKRELWLSV